MENVKSKLRPLTLGAVVGAIVLAVIGFTWGGWVTDGGAQHRAALHAETEVAAALMPFCLQRSTDDPAATEKMAALKSAGRFQRANVLMDHGWATVPGADEPNRTLAAACVEALSAKF